VQPNRRPRLIAAAVLATSLVLGTVLLPDAGGASTASTQSFSAPSAYSGAPTPAAQKEFDRINAERRARGLRTLRWRTGANIVARSWSSHQARYGMAHNPNLSADLRRQGVTGWRALGENVGFATDGVKMHAAFMRSSGHRANILKASYTHVGIGVIAKGPYLYYTLDFLGY
jgi:uncharacterized protein YkwD